MDNKTKVIIGLTFIIMVLVYQTGRVQTDANYAGPVITQEPMTTVKTVEASQPQSQKEEAITPEVSTMMVEGEANYPVVSDVAVRIRIIPNSNSYEDQQAKKMVTYAMEEYLSKHTNELSTLESTREFIGSNISTIENVVENVLETMSYSQGYELTYGAHLFPEKELNGKTYDEGYYESLVIKLGEGHGSNWWCFMNAALCLGPSATTEDEGHWNSQYETTKQTQEDIANQDVKFFVGEVLSNLFDSNDETPVQEVASNQTAKSLWYLYEDEY